MHQKNIVYDGALITEAQKALIMIHGQGATANDIIPISTYLRVKEYAIVAPQAINNTWYPHSFLASPSKNEPWLSSALDVLDNVVNEIVTAGIGKENIYFFGFSQGACLSLEFVTRNASKWGGLVAYTGGLIGDKIYSENYKGDFAGTPVFIGTSDCDAQVPVERVNDSADILKTMNASVTLKIYKNMRHTINQDEINHANSLIFK